MGQRRRFSTEYKREAVAMLESPGVNVSQIAAELGIGSTWGADGKKYTRSRTRRFRATADRVMRS